VTVKCPKCDTENTSDSQFCKKCATPIPPSEEPQVSHTKTIETPREELTTGSTFAGRYQIIEELGRGGMGKVYKVFDTKIKDKIALKLLKPEIASDKKIIERFSNELKFARKIRHKNVCQMFDLSEEKGTHFITMEYVHGEDLKRFIRKVGTLSAGQATPIAKQVCEGLAEAHQLGVVHRDLKPQNIMVDEDGNARIMDFGIARSLKAKGITGAGVMIGTPEYMSPEQVEGKEVDQRSDIYSLGVILYEMVTGRVPFEGDTPFTVGVKHKSEIPKNPKDLNAQVPEDLSAVILKCLEKDKDQRYQSAGEVRSELENIEKGIPTTERKVPVKKSLTSKEITVQFTVRKLLIPALVIIALALIGVVIWQLLPQKEAILAPKIENSVAVISFENQTGDKAFDYLQKAIPNLLITSLEQTGYLHVATWERMRDLLKQMGKEDAEIIDRDLGFELCRRDGIEAIVLGIFIKAGDVFATDVKLLDVETKKLLMSASSKGEGVSSILRTQIDELSREISLGVGISNQKVEEAKTQIADVTTTSMEAYKYYLKGTEAGDKYYWDDARKYLEKAVELDPTFAMAYSSLAILYRMLGNTKAMNEAFEKAKTLSQKATEKERLNIESQYALFKEGNIEKALRILKQITTKYPKEKRTYHALGYIYQNMNSLDEAIAAFNKVLELDPYFGVSINQLGYIYADMGDYEKSLEYFKRYASVSPGDANPIDSMAEMYFRMGKLNEAILKYKEVLEIKPDFGSSASIGYIYALKENYSEALRWIYKFIEMDPSPGRKAAGCLLRSFIHAWVGKFNEALNDVRTVQKLAESISNNPLKASMDGWMALILAEKGDLEQSKNHIDRWFESMKKYDPQNIQNHEARYALRLGLVDLMQGHNDSARTRLVEMKSLLPKISPAEKKLMTFDYNLLQGEILLAEGSLEEAIAVFEKAIPMEIPAMNSMNILFSYSIPFMQDGKARAYLQKGELDKAIAEYEQLIIFKPESKDRRLIHPKYYYRLAKLYEQKGWKGKAIEHYQKFLSLWKDADPGIAEVEDAKKRLPGLKTQ